MSKAAFIPHDSTHNSDRGQFRDADLMPPAKRMKFTLKSPSIHPNPQFPKPLFPKPNNKKLNGRVCLSPGSINSLKQKMRRNIHPPIPPTPMKPSQRIRIEKSPFETPRSLVELGENTKIDATSYQKLNISGKYTLNGKDHLVIKQRENSTECGAAAAYMLYSDEVLNGNINSELGHQYHAFWGWYQKSSLYNANDLENGLSLLEGLAKAHIFLESRKSKIESTKDLSLVLAPLLKYSSVIINITNKVIHGHFIIVDEVTENTISFRDSYTGKAYEMDLKTFFNENLKEDSDLHLPISLINLRKVSLKK